MDSPASVGLDVFGSLPRGLQHRLQSIGAYVDATLTELQESRPITPPLTKAEASTVKFFVITVKLIDLLERTTRAAEGTVELLEKLDLRGFVVGTSVFERDSPDLLRGRRLSERLRQRLPPGTPIPTDDETLSLLVRRARAEVIRDRAVG